MFIFLVYCYHLLKEKVTFVAFSNVLAGNFSNCCIDTFKRSPQKQDIFTYWAICFLLYKQLAKKSDVEIGWENAGSRTTFYKHQTK